MPVAIEHLEKRVGRRRETRVVLATATCEGGGIKGGRIYGASDKHAAAPAENPTSPADLTATMYHALGIDPGVLVADRLGREQTLTTGTPLTELFG